MATYPPMSQPIPTSGPSNHQYYQQQQQNLGPYSQSPTSQAPFTPSPYLNGPPQQAPHQAVTDLRGREQGYFPSPPPAPPYSSSPTQHHQRQSSSQSLKAPGSPYAQGYPSPQHSSPRQMPYGSQGYPSPLGPGQPSPGLAPVPQHSPLPPQGYPSPIPHRRQSSVNGTSYEYQTPDGQLAPYSSSPSARAFPPSSYEQNYGSTYPPQQRPRLDSQGSQMSRHSHHSHHSHHSRHSHGSRHDYDDRDYDDRRHEDRHYDDRDYEERDYDDERRPSHDSQHSPRRSREVERRLKEAERRPTMGDSLVLMWDTVKGAITGRRE